ncbi:cellulose synthase [Burkholderia thailandensis]|nr:cellulose synthase [Burkholderia thailandensis]AOI54436.1 cellulose synthase [Burkholderia thailandensis]AOJ59365.1 cellulose synthase [Burkholderia thailandensis]AWY62729.1 cellulose synthase [Burkholderia thailandensis]AWY65973.1 cellulose synthase [Burkholderia thailandensis]
MPGRAARERGDFRAPAAVRERSTRIVRRVRSGAGLAGAE